MGNQLEVRKEMLENLGKNCEYTLLTKPTIDQIFETARVQTDYVLGLYRAVIPNWDAVVDCGYPVCNKNLNEYIFEKAMAFDKEHHPDIMAGGLWLNNGFSTLGGHEIDDWFVVLPNLINYHSKEFQKQLALDIEEATPEQA